MQSPHRSRPDSRAFVHLACLLFACCDANWCLNAGSADADPSTGSESSSSETTDPSTDTTDTSDPCGDGVCGPGENSESCLEDCPVAPPGCGDGEVAGSEVCDDGDDNGQYGKCKKDCSGTTECGDGEKNGPEVCDEGASNSDDYAATPHCNADCSALAPHCGDDECQGDDGESANNCVKDCAPACGNGVVETGEDCDVAGGGNTATCDADCTTVMCGDSQVNDAAGEACDDGNAIETDACIACVAAICGDGIVQEGVEECDDENQTNDDTCSNACQKPRRVFVTSALYKGNLGGLAGADQKCQGLADAAVPKLEGTFLAWLSDGAASPATRLDTTFTGAYQLVNGGVIASNGWADLTDGTLAKTISINENKNLAEEENVWTGTAPDGSVVPDQHCMNWTVGNNTAMATHGETGLTDGKWTQSLVVSCGNQLRLYCIENP